MRKRNSYKRDNVESQSKKETVVTNLNKFEIECIRERNNEPYFVDFSFLYNGNNYQDSQVMMSFFRKYRSQNQNTMLAKRDRLKNFINFMQENNITLLKDMDYNILTEYKNHLKLTMDKKTTQATYFTEVKLILQYISNNNSDLVSDDVGNNLFPKNIKISKKSPIEKDLENRNKGYNDEDCNILLVNCSNIIMNENLLSDKYLSLFIILCFITGANPSVLREFTNEDLTKLSEDFDYLDFVKFKGRKGIGGAEIKITIKNMKINNYKFSDLVSTIKNEKISRIVEWENHPKKDLMFLYPKKKPHQKKDEFTLNWSFIGSRTYIASVKNLFKRHNIKVNTEFTVDRVRKYFERSIYNQSGSLELTSSLMGHSPKVASQHYLNQASSLESHQKLVLTQDIIDGFSKNKKTDNFLIYNKLLNLYNIDLETAIKLSKKGFSIEEIIKQSGELEK